MKLSMTNSIFWRRLNTEQVAGLLSSTGFDAVDCCLNDMADDNDRFNKPDYREQAVIWRKCMEDKGLTVNQTHAPCSFQNWDDPVYFEEVIFDRIRRSLEITAIMGAEITIVHPLRHFTYAGHEEEIFQINMDFYRRLLPYCKEYDVKIAVENMWRRDPGNPRILPDVCAYKDEFVRYIDTLDSEYVVACLDIGHASVVPECDRAPEMIRALGHERLRALHVHDNNMQLDQHLLPFSGKINWPEVTAALHEIGYQGELTYEPGAGILKNVPDGFLPTAMKYMADVGRYLIQGIETGELR